MVKIQIETNPELAEDTGILSPDAPLDEQVIHALRKVYDPELPVNVYDLGLIYGLNVENGHADVTMTLTAPTCPVADMIVQDVQKAVEGVDGINKADVNLVWTPKWTKERMSLAAKIEVGFI